MNDSKFWLGQLRHAYKNALDGRIASQREYASLLLGPAVAGAERYVTAAEKLEGLLRKEWWLNHGCNKPGHLYGDNGDNGEMQCGQCGTDFRRMLFDVLSTRVEQTRLTAALGE